MRAIDYLGKEWVSAEYDCWGLVRDIYQRELNIKLPFVCVNAKSNREVIDAFDGSKIYSMFEEISEPEHFSVLLIGNKKPRHCGVYLNVKSRAMVIHNQRGFGVVCESISILKRKANILSYHRFLNNG